MASTRKARSRPRQNAAPPRRRRRWSTADKIKLIERTTQPGMSVSRVARRAGITPSMLFQWRARLRDGELRPTAKDGDGSQRVRELERRVRELERHLGRKTMEAEILKEVLVSAGIHAPMKRPHPRRGRKSPPA